MIWGVSSNDGREQWVSHLVHFAMKIVCRYNIPLDRGWIVPLAAWKRGSTQLTQVTLLLGSLAQKWSLVGGYGESSGLGVWRSFDYYWDFVVFSWTLASNFSSWDTCLYIFLGDDLSLKCDLGALPFLRGFHRPRGGGKPVNSTNAICDPCILWKLAKN